MAKEPLKDILFHTEDVALFPLPEAYISYEKNWITSEIKIMLHESLRGKTLGEIVDEINKDKILATWVADSLSRSTNVLQVLYERIRSK